MPGINIYRQINVKIMFKKLVENLENTPLTFKSWGFSFFAIIAVRFLIESFLNGFKSRDMDVFFGLFLHGYLIFFLFSYLLFLIILQLWLKEDFKKLASFLLWGQWIIILPPIIDQQIFQERFFRSFYILDNLNGLLQRFFTFFGDSPHFGITYGTRVEVALVTGLMIFYFYHKTKDTLKTTLGTLSIYAIFFILGTFPSLVYALLAPFYGLSAWDFSVNKLSAFFLSPFSILGLPQKDILEAIHYKMSLILIPLLFLELIILQFILDKRKLWSLIRNIRYPQMMFNYGLFLCGLALGWFYYPNRLHWDVFSFLAIINILLMIFSAWFFSVFVNDVVDENIDKITNQDRPLVQKIFDKQEYIDYSGIFLVLSLIIGVTISLKVFLVICAYHFLTYVYSAYPFRLKRFLLVASALSAFASLLFLVIGFTVISPDQTMTDFPLSILKILFIGYLLAIPLKDLKDIEGDRQDQVYTLPVLVGEDRARMILASLIAICYFWSVFLFHEKLLFLPAGLCAAISFGIITNKKIPPRRINWQVLLTAAFYVIILTAIVIS